ARARGDPDAPVRAGARAHDAVQACRIAAVRGSQARARNRPPPDDGMTGPLLLAKGITKRFGGVQALADVGFTINRGEIYGLIGPNGGGNTSLVNSLLVIYV